MQGRQRIQTAWHWSYENDYVHCVLFFYSTSIKCKDNRTTKPQNNTLPIRNHRANQAQDDWCEYGKYGIQSVWFSPSNQPGFSQNTDRCRFSSCQKQTAKYRVASWLIVLDVKYMKEAGSGSKEQTVPNWSVSNQQWQLTCKLIVDDWYWRIPLYFVEI